MLSDDVVCALSSLLYFIYFCLLDSLFSFVFEAEHIFRTFTQGFLCIALTFFFLPVSYHGCVKVSPCTCFSLCIWFETHRDLAAIKIPSSEACLTLSSFTNVLFCCSGSTQSISHRLPSSAPPASHQLKGSGAWSHSCREEAVFFFDIDELQSSRSWVSSRHCLTYVYFC